MKSKILGGIAAAAMLSAGPVLAQATPQPAALVVAAPTASAAVLRTGTEVPLRLLEQLTTKEKQLRAGTRFHLETAEPLLVQGVTVIPAGTPAEGEITDVRNKGMWGKSGKFSARLLYLTVNGRQIRLGGEFNDKGSAGGAGAVAVSALVFAPAGFFMTGKSANMPAGTIVKGFIDEDVPLVLPATAAAAQGAPMVVGAPSATPGRALAVAGAGSVLDPAHAACGQGGRC
jgi:hypothetical protein